MSKEYLAAKMKPLVLKYHSSGQTRKAFAQSHGISQPKLAYWIKKFSKSSAKDKKGPSEPGFVPLKVKPSPVRERDHLVIRLGSGVEIEIPL